MPVLRRRSALTLAVSIAVAMAMATLYLLKLPPFEQRAAIGIDELCESIGPSGNTVEALENILPRQSEYSFDDTINARGGRKGPYSSMCAVWGEEKVLMSIRAETMTFELTETWVNQVVLQREPNRDSLKPFDAGDKALASSRVAAILVPCTPREVSDFTAHMSVTVALKQLTDKVDEQVRESLTDIARSAAEYAHERAKCELPSKL
ncbi:hypothetical protein ACIP88_22400 [Streptomyces uncialis]|uniref:hypothetical protein n=1 Tax=Streptomyces uncialis TaxID=1048205 RepID=UPI0037F775A6